MATHTPGPWRYRRSTYGGYEIVPTLVKSDVDRERISSVRSIEDSRLIAAAPELLKALKDLHSNVDQDLSGYWTESTSNFMQQAEAAIAKAEVRS